MLRLVCILGAVASISFAFPVEKTAPDMVVVADNLTWVENLWCDSGSKSLWAAESLGHLWQIRQSPSGLWTKRLHLSKGIVKIAGIIVVEQKLYALVNSDSSTGLLVSVNMTTPEEFQVVTQLPAKILGDGLAHYNGSLYITHEGDFVPGRGQVWRVDLATGELSVILKHKFATDGAFVAKDTGILYVSVVFGSKVIAIDLSKDPNGHVLEEFNAPRGVSILDDFFVSDDGSVLYGASYGTNSVDVFTNKPNGNLTASYGNLQGPASVRQGCDGVGGRHVFFASEGGSAIEKAALTRRVLMITP